jgi:hypothetical protein
LDVGTEALQCLFPPPGVPEESQVIDGRALDGEVDRAAYRRWWGDWSGREVEFFRECARLVSVLTWREVAALGGPEIQIYTRLTQEAYRWLVSGEIPARLKAGSFQIARMDPGGCRVLSYSPYDPLALSQTLVHVLRYFDGRSTDEVLRTIASEEGLQLNAALIRRLVDFGILVPCESQAGEG